MSKKILVVDDEPYIVKLVESRLKANGYTVITSYDGKDGIQKATQHIPDLILLDVMMPNMDGSAAAEVLRNNPKTKNIPVIFLTALVKKSEEKNTNHIIGGNYVIAKPFNAQDLLTTIKKVLDNKS